MATINLGAIKFNWKGAYNSGTSYAVDDVVSSGGNSYVCIQAHSNQAVGNATAYWNIMSSAGTNGTDGTDLTSTLTAQGDIVYRDGSGLAKLGAGTNGYFLKTQGTGANPVWAESSGGVLQMVHAEITTKPSRSSGQTYADISGLNVTITPSSTSNKILIHFSAGIVANTGRTTAFTIKRAISGGATTTIGGHTDGSRQGALVRACSDADGNHDYGVSQSYVDTSHNTTSAITYTMQWISEGTAYLNRSQDYGNGVAEYQTTTNSRIYAQEIGV